MIIQMDWITPVSCFQRSFRTADFLQLSEFTAVYVLPSVTSSFSSPHHIPVPYC